MSDLGELTTRMRRFTEERDWERFHDPKSLLLALVGEVGEVSELLQWLPAEEAVTRAGEEPLRSRLGEELGDVLLYLVRLADVLDIDLGSAAKAKLAASQLRFPVGEFRSTAPSKSDRDTQGLNSVGDQERD